MSKSRRRPTSIVENRSKSWLHTRIQVTFNLGFEHEVIYERNDRILGGDVSVLLDGKEIFREGIFKLAVGRNVKKFGIEGQSIGEIRITGMGVGLSCSVLVGGVRVLRV
jgi:hypothetical protein